jgi:Protein of unknown function (DUF3160)
MNFPRSSSLLFLVLAGCTPAPTPSDHPPSRQVATLAPLPSAAVTATVRTGPPTDEEVCVHSVRQKASALAGVHPFMPPAARCQDGDWFCDSTDVSPDPTDACFVANQNIARAERESHGARAAGTTSGPWDGIQPPLYLDRIDAHLHLTDQEHALLRRNGFVVLDRLPYANYANAFHDVFQEQLPLYVGIDPILHAVFRGTERALERVERKRLVPALASLLQKLRRSLAHSRGRFDPETLADLDVYLGVAWVLGGTPTEEHPSTLFGNDELVRALVDSARGSQGLETVEVFGRARVVDFSQLEPRGHYAGNPVSESSLRKYFQAVMWMSRFELNLVSRSCRSSQPGAATDPSETPREARDAMALADLVNRSGASAELRMFDEVYAAFAGRREDISPAELSRLMLVHGIRANDKEGFTKLKSAIGDGYRRHARTHYMPEGARELPAIATLLGPRIAPDVAPLTRLVHDALSGRTRIAAADVAYLLGHDRAKAYLAEDLGRFPGLASALDVSRFGLTRQSAVGRDVYASWLRSILALGPAPSGVIPSFMKREAYADFRMNSALVGYGQLRHAFVLLAAQGYDAYGCEIPDAYVEPLPAVYDVLVSHVKAMQAQARGWEGLERVLVMLRTIARAEADGRPLTDPQKRWLAMVAENIPVGGYSDSGEPPKWTGWYFDMFDDREHGATKSTSFVADYFSLTNEGEVAYLGAEGPRLGVFVVDVGGEPRAMVGPVAKGYETTAPIASRLDDEKALSLEHKTAAWRTGFAAPPQAEPRLGLEGRVVRCGEGSAAQWRVVLRSEIPIKAVQVTLLDHHADALTEPLCIRVGSSWEVHAFTLPPAVAAAEFGVEALHIGIADLGAGKDRWDYFTSPSVFVGAGEYPFVPLPERPRGVGAFSIGAVDLPTDRH